MTAVLIATTPRAELEPLGTGGHSAISVAPALHAALLRSLSPEHAALLAEPVLNARRDEIDWYAEVPAPPVPLPTLDPPARAAALEALDRLGSDIRGLAETLTASRDEGDRFLGELLRFALTVPDDRHVLVAAGRPVLVGWGHRAAGPRQPDPLIIGTRLLSRPLAGGQRMAIAPPPVPILGELPRPQPSGLWWAALALACLLWLVPLWLLSRALAAPPVCAVAPSTIALARRLHLAEATGAGLAARLGVLRSGPRCHPPGPGNPAPGGAPPPGPLPGGARP